MLLPLLDRASQICRQKLRGTSEVRVGGSEGKVRIKK
jgi:hypothetical protein